MRDYEDTALESDSNIKPTTENADSPEVESDLEQGPDTAEQSERHARHGGL